MLFDGHGDVWTDVTCRRIDHGETDVFRKRHLQKFRDGGVTGGIFVIWIDPPYDADPVARAKQVVECVKAEKADAADIINEVLCFDDFGAGADEGKLDIVTGFEGMSEIGEDIDQLDWYYEEMGVRHGMLTWNETNALATGWPGDPDRGLTPAGFAVVRRMQELGMTVDVSHLNDACFWDIMRVASGPVIASHSNARALCPAMRNLTDDMIKAIADSGGLLGMNSLREFVDERPEFQNVERLADHVEHIAELVGVEHIGLGYDFDDYLETEAVAAFADNAECPSCPDVSNERDASKLIFALRDRGFSEADLEAIAYRNFYRVFKETWR